MQDHLKAVSKFDPVHAQQVTFKDLQDAYDKAMKSNPNPYLGTPPFTTLSGHVVQQHDTPSRLSRAINRDILPDCVTAVDGAKDDLVNWVFEGFRNGVTQTTGTVRAYQISTGVVFRSTFSISRSDLDSAIYHGSNHMNYFLKLVEYALLGAIADIVTHALPPHDPETCDDPECPC